jgi:hypothetical protein
MMVSKKTLRIIMGVIWFLVAVLYGSAGKYPIALFSMVIVLFCFVAARKGSN